jgi:hypothetical protein
MAQPNPSVKRLLIGKANGQIVAVTAAASFVVVFCLIASFTLFGQLGYQNKVIGKKKDALNQIRVDLKSVDSLVTSYKAFVQTSTNIIGGVPGGTGSKDGDNAKIVLDALPSKYDFPALATSLDTILTAQNVQIQSISGVDDEVVQSASGTSSSPQTVPMPFEVTVSGDYAAVKNVVNAFNRSIRPMQIQTMKINGNESQMTLTISAQTFYQPEKVLNIKKEVVK